MFLYVLCANEERFLFLAFEYRFSTRIVLCGSLNRCFRQSKILLKLGMNFTNQRIYLD